MSGKTKSEATAASAVAVLGPAASVPARWDLRPDRDSGPRL